MDTALTASEAKMKVLQRYEYQQDIMSIAEDDEQINEPEIKVEHQPVMQHVTATPNVQPAVPQRAAPVRNMVPNEGPVLDSLCKSISQ